MDKQKELQVLVADEIKAIKQETGNFNLMISGGVDSSTLLASALDIGIIPDKLFTVRLPYGGAYDEFDDMLKVVSHFGMEEKLIVIHLDSTTFDEVINKAVKVIGRPIPHYNIFPLYVAFEKMQKMGIKNVVVGDGPDESMAGYARHIIMSYLYSIYSVDGLEDYRGMIDTILPVFAETYAKLIGKSMREVSLAGGEGKMSAVDWMCKVDMNLMRPDMTDMSHGLAKHFGITIHAPYEKKIVDEFMFNLPIEWKIKSHYGKYLLRKLGSYLGVPKSVIWRRHKIGGPLVPVNQLAGWDDLKPFDKSRYIELQKRILESV